MKKVVKKIIAIILLVILLGTIEAPNIVQTVYAAVEYVQSNDRGDIFENVYSEGEFENIMPFILRDYNDTIQKDYLVGEFEKAGKTVRNKSELQDIIGTGTEIKTNNETYRILIYGDVDGNGRVTVGDAEKTFRHAIRGGEYTLTGVYKIAANAINTDNNITVADAEYIFRFALGRVTKIPYKIPDYPKPTPTPTPDPTRPPVITSKPDPTPTIDPDPTPTTDPDPTPTTDPEALVDEATLTNGDQSTVTITATNTPTIEVFKDYQTIIPISFKLKGTTANPCGKDIKIESTNANITVKAMQGGTNSDKDITDNTEIGNIAIIGNTLGSSSINIIDNKTNKTIGTINVTISSTPKIKVTPLKQPVDMIIGEAETSRKDDIVSPVNGNSYTLFEISKQDSVGNKVGLATIGELGIQTDTPNLTVEVKDKNENILNPEIVLIIGYDKDKNEIKGTNQETKVTYIGVAIEDLGYTEEDLDDPDIQEIDNVITNLTNNGGKITINYDGIIGEKEFTLNKVKKASSDTPDPTGTPIPTPEPEALIDEATLTNGDQSTVTITSTNTPTIEVFKDYQTIIPISFKLKGTTANPCGKDVKFESTNTNITVNAMQGGANSDKNITDSTEIGNIAIIGNALGNSTINIIDNKTNKTIGTINVTISSTPKIKVTPIKQPVDMIIGEAETSRKDDIVSPVNGNDSYTLFEISKQDSVGNKVGLATTGELGILTGTPNLTAEIKAKNENILNPEIVTILGFDKDKNEIKGTNENAKVTYIGVSIENFVYTEEDLADEEIKELVDTMTNLTNNGGTITINYNGVSIIGEKSFTLNKVKMASNIADEATLTNGDQSTVTITSTNTPTIEVFKDYQTIIPISFKLKGTRADPCGKDVRFESTNAHITVKAMQSGANSDKDITDSTEIGNIAIIGNALGSSRINIIDNKTNKTIGTLNVTISSTPRIKVTPIKQPVDMIIGEAETSRKDDIVSPVNGNDSYTLFEISKQDSVGNKVGLPTIGELGILTGTPNITAEIKDKNENILNPEIITILGFDKDKNQIKGTNESTKATYIGVSIEDLGYTEDDLDDPDIQEIDNVITNLTNNGGKITINYDGIIGEKEFTLNNVQKINKN